MAEIDLGKVVGDQGPQGIQGPKGDQGIQGPKGDTGDTGPGVPTGGIAGMILTKASETNYDTKWVSPVNDANQTLAGKVLDARMGKTLNDAINTFIESVFKIEGDAASEYIEKGTWLYYGSSYKQIAYATKNITKNTAFDVDDNINDIGIDFVNFLIKNILPQQNQYTAGTGIAQNTNINTLTTPGKYYVASAADAATMTNIPEQSAGRLDVIVMPGSNVVQQRFFASGSSGPVYIRYYGSSWGSWNKVIYGSDMTTALAKKPNSLYISAAAAGTSHTLTLPNGFKGKVTHLGASATAQGEAIVDISSGGVVTMSTIYCGSGLTISSSANNTVTFTRTSSYTAYLGLLDFNNTDLSNVTLT